MNYVGSIIIDERLLEATVFYEYEKVQNTDVDNGARFETYVIAGEAGSVRQWYSCRRVYYVYRR